MQTDIGGIHMVQWQGCRLAPEQRAKGRIVRLGLYLAAIAALSLMIGFYSGLPVPLGLIRSAFVLVSLGALAVVASAVVSAIVHREESQRIGGRRG